MAKDYSAGVIVYKKFSRSEKLLILKHRKGHWALPKGHPDSGERKIETALRELKEETGIKDIRLLSKRVLVSESYTFVNGSEKKINKSVDYFIGETNSEKVKIDNKEIIKFKWCTYNAALKIITFKQTKNTLKKAYAIIEKKL